LFGFYRASGDNILLYVLVDMAAETARMNLAPLSF
jgi:hypothetical protein